MIPEGWKLKSVTVSREPSGKYFASLLFDCENQTSGEKTGGKIPGDGFCHAWDVCIFYR